MNQTLDFFSHQFERQIVEADYRLNPFEELGLAHVRGRVLDLGCGLGNFSIAAARHGLRVTAIDACPNATADLERRATAEDLPIRVECRELAEWRAEARYDAVVAIGLRCSSRGGRRLRCLTRSSGHLAPAALPS